MGGKFRYVGVVSLLPLRPSGTTPDGNKILIPLYTRVTYSDLWGVFFLPPWPVDTPPKGKKALIPLYREVAHSDMLGLMLYF